MFLPVRFYYTAVVITALLALGQWWSPSFYVGAALLALFALLLLVDIVLLWTRRGITASRQCSQRFSNGDDNPVSLQVDSRYPFAVKLEIIDEIPHIFQRRDVNFPLRLPARGSKTIEYSLRPTRRGVYGFGRIREIGRAHV